MGSIKQQPGGSLLPGYATAAWVSVTDLLDACLPHVEAAAVDEGNVCL
jgi:hypothetical protein